MLVYNFSAFLLILQHDQIYRPTFPVDAETPMLKILNSDFLPLICYRQPDINNRNYTNDYTNNPGILLITSSLFNKKAEKLYVRSC